MTSRGPAPERIAGLRLGTVFAEAFRVLRAEGPRLAAMGLGVGLFAAALPMVGRLIVPVPRPSPAASLKLSLEALIQLLAVAWVAAQIIRIGLNRLGPVRPRRVTAATWWAVATIGGLSYVPHLGFIAAEGLATSPWPRAIISWIAPAWSVVLGVYLGSAIPLAVDQELGPFRAIGRSFSLTRGSRWPLLGLSLLCVLVTYLVEYLALWGVLTWRGTLSASVMAWIGNAVPLVLSALLGPPVACLQVGVYRELWRARTGVEPGGEAHVFD